MAARILDDGVSQLLRFWDHASVPNLFSWRGVMQFSLKWILVAVVYVAVAAAAFSQQSWVYADLLWAVSLLAVVFAALLTFMGSGRGRLAAAGFLLAGLAYVACVAFGRFTGSDLVPTRRWLMTAGYDPNPPMVAFAMPVGGPMPQSNNLTAFAPLSVNGQPAANSNPYTLSVSSQAVPPPVAVVSVGEFAMYVRAANAVSMMLFGALGALVGLFAFKRISPTTPTVPS
jgi:hypothetical protein